MAQFLRCGLVCGAVVIAAATDKAPSPKPPTAPPAPPPTAAPTNAPAPAPAPAPPPAPPSDATPTPPEVRYTWSQCKCKDSWELDGQKCTEGCCNTDNDPFGDWCLVEDTECEDSDWGYCRPIAMQVPGCTDYPPDWSDNEGDGCYTYVFHKFCSADGKTGEGWENDWGTFADFTDMGYDASRACCGCGGGTFTTQGYNGYHCADTPDWKDKDGDNCQSYSYNNWCTASGGAGVGWHEEWGTMESFRNDGLIASEACCGCGGGGEGTNFPSTSYDPDFGGWWEYGYYDDDTTDVQPPSDGSMWAVSSGPCTKDSAGCITSPHYPANYQADEKCIIAIDENKMKRVTATKFNTEWGYDVLKINAISYSGSSGPTDILPVMPIVWTSDYADDAAGWRLCPEGAENLRGGSPSPAVAGETTLTEDQKHKGIAAGTVVLLIGASIACYCCCKKRTQEGGLGDGVAKSKGNSKYGRQMDDC